MAGELEATHEVLEHAAESASHGPPELPNILHILHTELGGSASVDFLYQWRHPIFAMVAAAFLIGFFYRASKHYSLIPGRVQAFIEIIFMSLFDVIAGILGEKEARRYFPLLGSLFLFIFCMNWFGLVPFFMAPTNHWKVTAPLAICVFLFCQYTALTRLGPLGYLYHLAGEPQDTIGWMLVPLFFFLHILEELIKPVSLACRLFGNILGEDTLLGVGLLLGIMLVRAFWQNTIIGVPFHFPFIFLSMLLGTIQALVFTLLAAVYISTSIPHEHHEEH